MPGEIYALLAAIGNATIGTLNRYSFEVRSSFASVAFWKCAGAFLVTSLVVFLNSDLRRQTWERRNRWHQLALVSFCGIFVLYFFETWAFSRTSIPVVSFLTYAGGILTIVLGVLFLGETLDRIKVLSIVSVAVGIILMFSSLPEKEGSLPGALLAIVGGLGYSTFFFLWRLFKVPPGLATLWWFFAFGSIFLGLPYLVEGPVLPDANTWPSIIALILIPTLGGYYFTARALVKTEAGRVQLIETSEPVFSSLFAWCLWKETLTFEAAIGASFILAGVLLLVLVPWIRKVPIQN